MSESNPTLPRSGNPLTRARWNPYLVGVGIGALSILAFVLADKPLGMSTQIAAASGAVCDIAGMDVSQNAYFTKNAFKMDYGMIFLLATGAGAFLSAITSKSFQLEAVPGVWRERFGGSFLLRAVAAFVGGFIILFGARLAGGCTSGHGISGSLQLAMSSWTFFLTMFATGLLTAGILFGFGKRKAA